MVAHTLSIVESLCSAAQGELTINQLAKVLRKSYGYTNTHVHSLVTQGILKKRAVGSALVCSLDYSTEETIGLLALSSIRKKHAHLESLGQKERAALAKTLCAIQSPALTIYADSRRITIVTDAQSTAAGERVRLVPTEEFAKEVRSLDLKTTVVLQHHEAFWTAIARERIR